MNTTSDADLVICLRNGDISAGGVLYERYKLNIFYFVTRMLRDDESARDVVQQTFVVMIEKIGTLRCDVTVRQWLFTVARNESLMVLRRKRLVPMEPLEYEENEVFDDDTPDTLYAKSERSQLVHQALDRMKPSYREVLLLRLTEELPYEEIAAITNTTVSSVKSKLFKARIALAKAIAPCVPKEDRL